MLRNNKLLAQTTRCLHTCTTIAPHPSALRNLALPLCFLEVQGWDSTQSQGWSTWTRLFAAQGYSSLLIQLDPQSSITHNNTSQALLTALDADLHSLLTAPQQGSPFPPLLFASSYATLVAQSYVSSHPLSGLLLHQPPPPSLIHQLAPAIFPTQLDEFTYEPNFPLGVMDELTRFESSRLGEEYRLEGDEGWLARIEGDRDEAGWTKVMDWMDENGL